MATTSKKSTLTTLFIVSFFLCAISCKDEHEGKGEWIPTPQDTSALAKRDHFIPLGKLDEFRKQYSTDRDTLMKCLPGFFMPESETFNKEWLLKVLKDPKNVGLRIYYGIRKTDKSN